MLRASIVIPRVRRLRWTLTPVPCSRAVRDVMAAAVLASLVAPCATESPGAPRVLQRSQWTRHLSLPEMRTCHGPPSMPYRQRRSTLTKGRTAAGPSTAGQQLVTLTRRSRSTSRRMWWTQRAALRPCARRPKRAALLPLLFQTCILQHNKLNPLKAPSSFAIPRLPPCNRIRVQLPPLQLRHLLLLRLRLCRKMRWRANDGSSPSAAMPQLSLAPHRSAKP